jgi:hypothetical protein
MNRAVKVVNLAVVFAALTVLTATAGVITTYHPRGSSFEPVVFDDSGFVFAVQVNDFGAE